MADSREAEYVFAAFRGVLENLKHGGDDVINQHVKDNHANLVKKGYVFVGWHGTTSKNATYLCNTRGGAYAKSHGYDPAVFNGCYTSSDVERCTGYIDTPENNIEENKTPVILRVYLKNPSKVSDIFLNSTDSKDAIIDSDSLSRNKLLKQGKGRYMIGGPDGTDFPGYELLLSSDLCSEVAFTLSSHTFFSLEAKYQRYAFIRKSKAKECSNVSWSIESGKSFGQARTDFINSLDKNNKI